MVGCAKDFFSGIGPFYNGGMSGTWSRVLIGDKPADVLEPSDAAPPRFGILFLHDLDGRTLQPGWRAFVRSAIKPGGRIVSVLNSIRA
jgi:hypothetical protein